MKDMFKKWKNSAAGKISLILLAVSALLLIVAYSSWGNLSVTMANNINNTLIGLATNSLGIIITVSFVQYFLDKQSRKQELVDEKAMILRYNRIQKILIERYIMYYNCITIPIEKRVEADLDNPRLDFPFEDMCDLYDQSLYLCEGLFEPSIVLFYKAEEKLRDYMIAELEDIQFKYHKELMDALLEFVEKSLAYDMRGSILGNINTSLGKEKLVDTIKKSIKDPSMQWVEKAHRGELGPNIMLPYVQLYDLLKEEIQLIIKCQKYIDKLEIEKYADD